MRTKGRRIAVTAVALAVSAGLFAGPTAAQLARGSSAPLGQFDVAVSVAPGSFGPMDVRVIHVRSDRHEVFAKLAIENTSRFTATMNDRFRTSVFARGGGGKLLLAADDGCGWLIEKPGDPVQPGICQADLRIYTLDQSEVAKLKVYAVRGLPGMSPLSAGHYEFDREVRFRFEKDKLPTAKGNLVVSFDVTRPTP